MAPKSPDELREQIEKQNAEPMKEGSERTAEGQEVPIPSRKDFLGNLEKVSKPEK